MWKQSNKKAQRGQSMVETALLFPILLLLFAGMIEAVFICRSYLVILDSSYQGAHLGSQGDALYSDAEIYTLVTQDLSPGYTAHLKDVIITRATWNGTSLSYDKNSLGIKYPIKMKGSSAVSIFYNVNPNDSILASRMAGFPATRLIAVEVVYDHQLLFDFPIIWDIFPDPFPLLAYSIQYVAR
jgi:hypothetical protein